MERSIIHLNIADFAVAVERLIDSSLKDYPLIIAPKGNARAVVYDMSEEAFQEGIRKGMALRKASRICKSSRILPPHFDRYERAMGDLIKQTLPYSPFIESGETDGHLFVDITGTNRLFGPPVDVAWRLNKKIKQDMNLNPIWSVAPNKLVAKVATRLVKPTGEYIVGAGEEKEFLEPLHIGLLPGIERSDLARLREFNFTRVSEVLAMTLEHLRISFGKRAGFIHDTIRGIDLSPVLEVTKTKPKLMADHEFSEDTNDVDVLNSALYILTEKICMILRKKRKAAEKLRIEISYTDGMQNSASMRIKPASANELVLYEKVTGLLDRAVKRRVRIRHMRLVCENYIFPQIQMELFENTSKNKKRGNIIATIDKIRSRFGYDAVKPGIANLALQDCPK
jgi:DNA polymerase-4